MSLLTAEEVTNLYLYGSKTKPANIEDETLIRENPLEIATTTSVDINEYMTAGPGRFASAAFFEVVKQFFSSTSSGLAPGTYTKGDLYSTFGLNTIDDKIVSIQQSLYDDGHDNYLERTYIWESTAFQIDNHARFVINADGSRYIQDFGVIPYSNNNNTEDFDFKSTSGFSMLVNSVLEPIVDPSGIGRTVVISFDGIRDLQDKFTYTDYVNTALTAVLPNPALIGNIATNAFSFTQQLFDNGSIRFLDTDNRPILYGSNGDDLISGTHSRFHALGSESITFVNIADITNPLRGWIQNGIHYIGGDGNDRLTGTQYDDCLSGGKDTDLLCGLGGNDTLTGGTGYDVYCWDTGDGNDLINDADGEGAILLNDIRLTEAWHRKDDAANVYQSAHGESLTLSGDTLTITMKDGGSLTVQHFSEANHTLGITLHSDQIGYNQSDLEQQFLAFLSNPATGFSVASLYDMDNVVAYSGNATLSGTVGNDELIGNPNNQYQEYFYAGSGNDVIYVDAPVDDLSAYANADNDPVLSSVSGAMGAVTAPVLQEFFVDSHQQLLPASAYANVVTAGEGEDVLVGGERSESLWGQAGAELLLGGNGADLLGGDNGGIGDGPNDGNDEIFAGAGDDDVYAGGGDDLVFAGSGDDYVIANGGNDEVFGGSGDDFIAGESIYERTVGVAYDDYLDGGSGNDTLFGMNGADTLLGDAGDDVLVGDDGYLPAGFQGDDVLDGGSGSDTLLGQGGNDTLQGGSGNDWLFGDSDLTPIAIQGDDYVDGGEGDDYLRGYGGNDLLLGDAGNDQALGEEGDDYLAGEAGDDVMSGGTGNDTLLGGAGIDALTGDEGDDYLDGGEGDDQTSLGGGLDGGAGNDTLLGGEGNDELLGGEGNDVLEGGADSDLLAGQAGDDSLAGGAGTDELQGGDGNDILEGGTEDDLLFGETGDDSLYGDSGQDVLWGDDGDDVLDGGEGNDVLAGGVGDDLLTGGAGSDIFQFGLGSGADSITDFTGTASSWDVVQVELTASGFASSLPTLTPASATVDLGPLSLQREGNDLHLSIKNTNDQLWIQGYFAQDAVTGQTVPTLQFADGRGLTRDHVLNLLDASLYSTVKLGDAPTQVFGSNPTVWSDAWTASGISLSHKANVASSTEAWSTVKLSALGTTTLAGGDIFGGDLGVSGQSLATSSIRQEIDGAEALRFTTTQDARAATFTLSRLFSHDDGLAFDEAGRLQAFKNGALVGETLFHADVADGQKQMTLTAAGGFDTLVLTSGAYNNAHQFIAGAYVNDDGSFATAPFLSGGTLHGSDYLTDILLLGISPALPA